MLAETMTIVDVAYAAVMMLGFLGMLYLTFKHS